MRLLKFLRRLLRVDPTCPAGPGRARPSPREIVATRVALHAGAATLLTVALQGQT